MPARAEPRQGQCSAAPKGNAGSQANAAESANSHKTRPWWQNRFYSCPLAQSHFWRALLYVELHVDLNPVRPGLLSDGTAYPWSSAAAHASSQDDNGMLDSWGLSELDRTAVKSRRTAPTPGCDITNISSLVVHFGSSSPACSRTM